MSSLIQFDCCSLTFQRNYYHCLSGDLPLNSHLRENISRYTFVNSCNKYSPVSNRGFLFPGTIENTFGNEKFTRQKYACKKTVFLRVICKYENFPCTSVGTAELPTTTLTKFPIKLTIFRSPRLSYLFPGGGTRKNGRFKIFEQAAHQRKKAENLAPNEIIFRENRYECQNHKLSRNNSENQWRTTIREFWQNFWPLFHSFPCLPESPIILMLTLSFQVFQFQIFLFYLRTTENYLLGNQKILVLFYFCDSENCFILLGCILFQTEVFLFFIF